MKSTILTLFACIACLFSFSQDAVKLGNDTTYGEITEATIAHIVIDGKKVLTQTVDRVMYNGDWMYKSTFLQKQADGDLRRDILEFENDEFKGVGMTLESAGTQGVIGVVLMVVGGTVMALSDEDIGLYAGGGLLACGGVLQLSAFNKIGSAGTSLRKLPSP